MTEHQASEVIQEIINQLKREKSNLNSRLTTLNRENLPHLNTRAQRNRLIQIDAIRERLTEIDNELNKQRYKLACTKNKPIDNPSQTSQYSVSDKRKSKKLKSLEKFLNLSKEMSDIPDPFKKKPLIPRSPLAESLESNNKENPVIEVVVRTIPETETSTTVTASMAATEQIQIDNVMSSTPKTLIKPSKFNFSESKTDSKTLPTKTGLDTVSNVQTIIPPRTITGYMKSNLGKFEFPPNYESAEDRTNRLAQEKILKDKFDYNMLIQDYNREMGAIGGEIPYTGTVPKSQFLVKSTPLEMKTNETATNIIQKSREQIPIYIDDGSMIENLQLQQNQFMQSHNPNINLTQESNQNTWNDSIT